MASCFTRATSTKVLSFKSTRIEFAPSPFKEDAPWRQIALLVSWIPLAIPLMAVRLLFLVVLIPFLLVKRDWHSTTVVRCARRGAARRVASSHPHAPASQSYILPLFGIVVKYRGPCRDTFQFPSLVCSNHNTGDIDFFPFMSVLRAGPLVDEDYFASSWLAQIFLPSVSISSISTLSFS